MKREPAVVTGILLSLLLCAAPSSARPVQPPAPGESLAGMRQSALLAPPVDDGPVKIRAAFHMLDINEIDDEAETFEFSGMLTLTWRDKRQAFDPAEEGTAEKVYVGAYQFNEIAPAWYPQVVLTNTSGRYEKYGTLLRVKPDGTSTLVETISAVAETGLDLRRYPYDRQRLEAVFEVLGFDTSEVMLEAQSLPEADAGERIRIPQWSVTGLGASTRNIEAPYAGDRGVSSAFVLSVDVQRQNLFVLRLIVMPLVLIVMLSWSVFWMDRSSLGDRMAVSFVGILSAVAYLLVISDILPQISYATLIHGFLNISFWIMCATVGVNLVVGACDRKGKSELGNRIDHLCRWAFPLAYGILLSAAVAIFFL